MAYPQALIIGNQLLSANTVGVAKKTPKWERQGTLASSLLCDQLLGVAQEVNDDGPPRPKITYGLDDETARNYKSFRNSITVEDHTATIHGYWNPSKGNTTEWKKNNGGPPPDEWMVCGGTVTLAPGLRGVRRLLEAVLPLLHFVAGGSTPIAKLAANIYNTAAKAALGIEMPKPKKGERTPFIDQPDVGVTFTACHNEKKQQHAIALFEAFMQEMLSDTAPLILTGPPGAIRTEKTFFDRYLCQAVVDGHLHLSMAQIAKNELIKAVPVLVNKFRLHFLLEEIIAETLAQGEENDAMRAAADEAEAGVELAEQEKANRAASVVDEPMQAQEPPRDNTPPHTPPDVDLVSPPTSPLAKATPEK
jgi:hypothetical protein